MPAETEPPSPAPLADSPRFSPLSIAAAPLPSVEVQQKEHVVVAMNDAFCQILGKTREEIIGRRFAEIVPGGEDCVPVLDGVYETGKAKAYAQANPADTSDDSDSAGVYWLYAMWPALDAGQRPVGVIIQLTRAGRFDKESAAVNGALLIAGLQQHELRERAEGLNRQLQAEIAERRKVELTLNATLQELQQAHWATERASLAKDNFMAALSHELRTPLTPVLLAATDLAADPSLPQDARDLLAMMRRNIELEARLIDDLLDVTRITTGKLRMSPKIVDLHALIRQADEITGKEARAHGVSVVFRLEAARHHVLGDAVRLQQVLWNVLRNAIKFTPEGGTVTVSTRNDSAGKILAMVEDTGIGIAAEALPGVFNLFEQGKVAGQRYGGLGLGLAISHAIMSAHGGAICAESEGEGMGAKFTITLDSMDAPLGDAAPERPAAKPERSLRLLIVEDHTATRELLLRLLTRHGHRVTAAASLQSGLAAFRRGIFDVVISDLGLPDGSGLALMREIRTISPVPAIALSGYGMEEDVQRAKEAGFSAHLVKPVELEQLQALLGAIAVGEQGGSTKESCGAAKERPLATGKIDRL